jgi:hypothetical protein
VRLDLDRPRTLGELVGLTFELFGRHLGTFLSLTLLVVAPVVILVDGVWGGYLADGGNADPSVAASGASLALGTVVIPPLVTALHVVVVQHWRAVRSRRSVRPCASRRPGCRPPSAPWCSSASAWPLDSSRSSCRACG